MGGRRLVERIIGLCSTTRGFAAAITDGPGCLVAVKTQRTDAHHIDPTAKAIDDLFYKWRPDVVAFERDTALRKGGRGQQFGSVVVAACQNHGITMIPIRKSERDALSPFTRPTKWDVARAMASRFPEVAHKLPPRRKAWQSEDDRVGIFMALAATVIAWRTRKRRGG